MCRTCYDQTSRRIRDLPCGALRVYLDVSVRRVDCPTCGRVKQERLDWLARNPPYTKRFAWYVGHRCRSASIHEVAPELRLDWHAVRAMETEYMQAQLDVVGPPAPHVIGIDEISIRKGHVYRIIVNDLERAQPIWFGGVDRGDASMTMFYDFLGASETAALRLAVMDMWKPFRKATRAQAPQGAILYDKFHVLRQLGSALDHVRKSEYKRLTHRPDRRFIKGQKYILLSHRENFSPEKRASLATLHAANKRLNTAYLLKEQFAHLWEHRSATWARKFFEAWRQSLRWQRLPSFEKFADLIDQHWDGIAAYCVSENKVALGFVEGLNNKIHVIQCRCYGIRDENYLHLKFLTCTLPSLPQIQNRVKSPTRNPEEPHKLAVNGAAGVLRSYAAYRHAFDCSNARYVGHATNMACNTLRTLVIVEAVNAPRRLPSRSSSTVRIRSRMTCPSLPPNLHATRNGYG